MPKDIHVTHVGKCPMGWDAYKSKPGSLYYIRQPNEVGEMSWYRCSKDWEPQWEVHNDFVVDGVKVISDQRLNSMEDLK